MNKKTAIIGLGSSLGDKKIIFDEARDLLKRLGENFRISFYMETEPLGGVAKNTFLNAVCCFETDISPFELLDKLQQIEAQFGRTRKKRWEDRTLDLDILYFGHHVLTTTKLTIPHPEINNRAFIQAQIRELFPSFDFGDSSKIVVGILNITPDSFYDGGRFSSEKDYKNQIDLLVDQGADLIDVGGFSSRPGSTLPSVEEELRRIYPVLKYLTNKNIDFSVDTCRYEVLKEIVHFKNLKYINDISGGSDERIFELLSSNKHIGYVLMHTKGTPETMQINPNYTDIVAEIYEFFKSKIALLHTKGIYDILLDPGFGFGKTITDNYTILSSLQSFRSLGYPIYVGMSRKSMLYKLLATSPKNVLPETSAVHLLALMNGAKYLRVHDVQEAKNIIKIFKKMQ